MSIKGVSNKKPALNIGLAYQGFLNEPVPSTIFDAIVSGKVGRLYRVVKTALILLVGALLAVIALNVLQKAEPQGPALLSADELAVSAHATFSKDNVYPVQVSADDMEHLTDWLSYRTGRQLAINDLSGSGYTLLGGSIVPDTDSVSALVVYENQENSKLSLFIRNAVGTGVEGETDSGRYGQSNWLSWQHKGRQMVLVSELDGSELQSVFERLN